VQSASGFYRANGLRLFVHRFHAPGVAPSGLTVLLVHGFLDAGATWELVARPLAAAGHDVFAPDLRGFGASDWVGPGGYYHFPDYVADLAALAEQIAPSGAIPARLGVVGHSMGGTIAGLFAGAHPGRVERLALLEGMGPLPTEPAFAIDRMQAWLRDMRRLARVSRPLGSMREAVERLQLHHSHVPRDVIETRAERLTRTDEAGQLAWAYDPMHRTTSPTPFQAESFKAFLRNIDCPVLVVGGGKNGWHPHDEEERIACLRHPTLAELPAAGHMMHWTEPEALSATLLDFFARGPLPKPPPAPGATVPPDDAPEGAPRPDGDHLPRSGGTHA
jgi:pimeloyl-ACP methyl ester carboxylesterase